MKMDLLSKVKQLKEKEDSAIKQAFDNTPEKYHDFIMTLEHKQAILHYEINSISEELEELGVETWGGKTRLKVNKPYMVVAGKVRWFADNHIRKEDGEKKIYKYSVSSNIEKIAEIIEKEGRPPELYPYIIKINSELYGELEGESSINWSRDNCLEDAKTSALGRAITSVGIGAIGSGLSSYEEVMSFLNNKDKGKNDKKKKRSQKKQKPKNKNPKDKKSQKKKKNTKPLKNMDENYREIEDGITKKQAMDLYKKANKDKKIIQNTLKELGYDTKDERAIMLIKDEDYDDIMDIVKARAAKA